MLSFLPMGSKNMKREKSILAVGVDGDVLSLGCLAGFDESYYFSSLGWVATREFSCFNDLFVIHYSISCEVISSSIFKFLFGLMLVTWGLWGGLLVYSSQSTPSASFSLEFLPWLWIFHNPFPVSISSVYLDNCWQTIQWFSTLPIMIWRLRHGQHLVPLCCRVVLLPEGGTLKHLIVHCRTRRGIVV